jgi:hypoxanthine-DNA glycosylase
MQKKVILTGFPPIVPKTPRVLVLGSMPGDASLGAQQYYAHPRNAFWPVMQALFGIDIGAPYENRIEQLKAADIALWDVVHQCHRSGSLDTAIELDSVIVNDIAGLLQRHPTITAVFCNGGGAWTLLRRYFLTMENLKPASKPYINIPIYKLPSTSPANARLSLQQKCIEWQLLKELVKA